MNRGIRFFAWVALSSVVACGGSPKGADAPPPLATGEPQAPRPLPVAEVPRVLPKLDTGVLEPLEAQPWAGRVVASSRQGAIETYKVALPEFALSDVQEPWVVPSEKGTGPRSFVSVPRWRSGAEEQGPHLWLRRVADGPLPPSIAVTLLTRRPYEKRAAERRTIDVSLGGITPKPNKKLDDEYLAALAVHLEGSPLGAVLAPYIPGDNPAHGWGDWSSLMQMMSGYDSIEAALYHNETLRLAADPRKATVPLDSLAGPELRSHPWAAMLAALPKGERPTEPLSLATPNDFYFVRAKDFDSLQALLDEVDTWLTPSVRLARGEGRRYDLATRYRAQLGLQKSELVRILGPKLIRDLALVGSDPFLRQGSDVTLLLRPFDPQALANALSTKLRMDHPQGVTQSSFERNSVRVTWSTIADGTLNQFVAQLPAVGQTGPVTVVSNSRGAVERIIDTAIGKSAALSAEQDFQYMLARDASLKGDVLCYLGDSFVQSSISAKQRIVDARRQLGRAELLRLGHAALLHGWVHGKEPKDIAELALNSWFDKSWLKHTSGEKIEFRIGEAPRSSVGTPAFLTPLIDIPVPAKVTPAEQSAYESFKQSYSFDWSEHVDPIAVRFSVSKESGKTQLNAHVRVLPVVNSSDYREVWSWAGSTQVSTRPAMPSASVTLGIAPDSRLRELFSGEGRSFLGRDFSVDWLGDWVSVGVADEPSLGEAVQLAGEAPELPKEERADDFDVLSRLPVYAMVEIEKRGAAALVLTVLRKLAQDAAPDTKWGELEKRGGVSIVEVQLDEVRFFYALAEKRLIASLHLDTLKRLLDTEARGETNTLSTDEQGAQLNFDLNPRDPSGIVLALAWAIESELRDRMARDATAAEALFFGTPTLSPGVREGVAMNYWGSLPITADGAQFELTQTGVSDPTRGSPYRQVFPEVPVPGSALQGLLEGLSGVKLEVAFDREPGPGDATSLRTKVYLERTSQ